MNVRYEMDGEEKVTKIKSLWAAVQWFKKSFEEEHYDNPKFRHFDIVDTIRGDQTVNYTKSYSKLINQEVSEKNLQYERDRNVFRTKRYDMNSFPICYVVAVTVITPFSTKEKRYYYIIKRDRWYSRWANNHYPAAKKYFSKDGFTVKADILMHSIRNPKAGLEDTSAISTLVIVMEDTPIYYINMDKLNRLGGKGLGVVTDKWNQQVVGIPRDELSEIDVNKYD